MVDSIAKAVQKPRDVGREGFRLLQGKGKGRICFKMFFISFFRYQVSRNLSRVSSSILCPKRKSVYQPAMVGNVSCGHWVPNRRRPRTPCQLSAGHHGARVLDLWFSALPPFEGKLCSFCMTLGKELLVCSSSFLSLIPSQPAPPRNRLADDSGT